MWEDCGGVLILRNYNKTKDSIDASAQQGEVGQTSTNSYNQVNQMQKEIARLEDIINQRDYELLGLYRRLLNNDLARD